MKRLSLRLRLSLFHTAAMACGLALAALAGHWALTRLVLGQLDAAILTLVEIEAAALQADPEGVVRVHEFAPGTAPHFARLDRFVQVATLDGRVLASSLNLGTARLPLTGSTLQRLQKDEIVLGTLDSFGDEPIRVVAMPVVARGRRYVVQAAGSLDDAYTLLATARWLFAGLSAALLAAVGITGAAFARHALQPIDEIVAQARSIGDSKLGERLPHPGHDDELGRLVDTLNAMLDRVERGIVTQKRFTADASHELRSPLSRLRTELEVTLRRPRERPEYEEALRSCLEEVERLSQLTDELLALARLDAEGSPRETPPVPLLPLVNEVVHRLQPQAGGRAVRLLVTPAPDLAVRVTPTAVCVALANVLDNALKFSPRGGQVQVGVSSEGPDALILVSDDGPGIAPSESDQLFDRFHRGLAARSGDAPGFGLGLAISRAAIERQGGRIAAENRSTGGATFCIRLPRAG